jgi:hypothetical protein
MIQIQELTKLCVSGTVNITTRRTIMPMVGKKKFAYTKKGKKAAKMYAKKKKKKVKSKY